MTNLTLRQGLGYLFTNRLHVFLMPILPTLFWNMTLQLPLPPSYYLMIVLTTAAGYIFNIYTDHVEDGINYEGAYLVLGRGDKLTGVAMVTCYVGSNLCALAAGVPFLLFNMAQHVLGCLYSAPLRVAGATIRVKQIPFVKNLYAAMFWSVALMLTPFVYTGQAVTLTGAVIVMICFGLSYFVELSWDVRDIPGDQKAGVRTVPIVMGLPFTFGLLATVHIVTCLLCFWAVWSGLLSWPYALVFFVNLIVGLRWLGWYRRQDAKTMGSHLYVVWLGVLFAVGTLIVAQVQGSAR